MTEEDEYFPPPKELREALPAAAAALAFGLGAVPPSASPVAEDRATKASDVLRSLVG